MKLLIVPISRDISATVFVLLTNIQIVGNRNKTANAIRTNHLIKLNTRDFFNLNPPSLNASEQKR